MIQGHAALTKEMLLNHISEEELFKFYCSNFKKLDTFFCAEPDLRPYGNPDTKASCKITRLSKGIYYKDFGTSALALDIWNYVQIKYGLSYHEALEKVAMDFGLINNTNISAYSNKFIPPIITNITKDYTPTILPIARRKWNLDDKKYWLDNYLIGVKLLESFDVTPITHFWVKGYPIIGDKLAYCYLYYEYMGVWLKKIYQPESVTRKWTSNINNTVVQGINNIPKTSDLLIITSSLKDIITLTQMGYHAVAPNNEMTWLPVNVWNKFISRYSKKIILFNTDLGGFEGATNSSRLYNIPYTYIPKEEFNPKYNGKDPSDLVKELHSIDKAHKIIEGIITMVLKEQQFNVQYRFTKNNRVHSRVTPMYSNTEDGAISKLKSFLNKFNISTFDEKVVSNSNSNTN